MFAEGKRGRNVRFSLQSTVPRMTPEQDITGRRVLIVEDELMIRMLLQDMLADLGHTLAGEAGRIDEAVALAKQGDFDVAILDVNLNGQPILPVVEILVERGFPSSLPRLWPARRARAVPADANPCKSLSSRMHFTGDRDGRAAGRCLNSKLYFFTEKFGKLCHIWLVGHVELERRHRDAMTFERGKVGAFSRWHEAMPHIGDPVIRIAAAVLALDRFPTAPAVACPVWSPEMRLT